jgi:hypothetical protein
VKWIGVLQTARGWFNSRGLSSMGAASGTGQLALMFALRFALDGGGFELGRVSSRYPVTCPCSSHVFHRASLDHVEVMVYLNHVKYHFHVAIESLPCHMCSCLNTIFTGGSNKLRINLFQGPMHVCEEPR